MERQEGGGTVEQQINICFRESGDGQREQMEITYYGSEG